MSDKLRRIESLRPLRASEYGGKARNLALLAKAGFPVPRTYALSSQCCRRFLHRSLPGRDWLSTVLRERSIEPTEAYLREVREQISKASLPVVLRHSVRDALRDMRAHGAHRVVIRSSATVEDASEASAAGLFVSRLNLQTESDVFDAIRDCWASLYQPHCISYLSQVAGVTDASMGLVLQSMLEPEVSGVLFTMNPLTGDPHEYLVSAAYGLGTAVVEGIVSPDMIRVDRDSRRILDAAVGAKQTMIVPGPGGSMERRRVPLAKRAAYALDDSIVEELTDLGRRAEQLFGSPQDIEWALSGGRVHVLQSRPITVNTRTRSHSTARRSSSFERDSSPTTWSNVNVGEALPGVVTPLTWSVLSNFSDYGFRRAFRALGCRVPADVQLVGNFRGRIYLNLTDFFAIASQVPGLNPATLLSLGGGTEQIETPELKLPDRVRFFASLPITATRFVQEHLRLATQIDTFEKEAMRERNRVLTLDLRVLSPNALDQTLWDAERMLQRTGGVMLSCYGNLLLGVLVLRTVLRLISGDWAPKLERELLSGLEDLESTKPAFALGEIVQIARKDPQALETLLKSVPANLSIEEVPAGPTREALSRFFVDHGHRGPREAELSSPRWSESPALVFTSICAALKAETTVVVDADKRAKTRRSAEQFVENRLPGPSHLVVRKLLSTVQRFVRLREKMRSHVTEILGLYRRIALEASKRMRARDESYPEDAALFLTVDELHNVLSGQMPNVRRLVMQRQRQYERDCALPSPPSSFVGQPPPTTEIPDSGNQGLLHGLAASAGFVRGRARVIHDIAEAVEIEADEILVVPHADVGWSPLFLVARGVVTDLGGPLSHAAIVLREYGVPAVVNVEGATSAIQTGDLLTIDGDRGTVSIDTTAA